MLITSFKVITPRAPMHPIADATQYETAIVAMNGLVSEPLSGKRDLNRNQIARLSERFGVSPATFF